MSEFLWLVFKKEIAEITKRQIGIFIEALQLKGEFIEMRAAKAIKRKTPL